MSAVPTGATYESLEDRFVADATELARLQKLTGAGEANENNNTIINTMSYNATTGNLSITATIPLAESVSTNGQVSLNPIEQFA